MMPKPVIWFNQSWPVWVSALLVVLISVCLRGAYQAGAVLTTVENMHAEQQTMKVDAKDVQGKVSAIGTDIGEIKGFLLGSRQKVADAAGQTHNAD